MRVRSFKMNISEKASNRIFGILVKIGCEIVEDEPYKKKSDIVFFKKNDKISPSKGSQYFFRHPYFNKNSFKFRLVDNIHMGKVYMIDSFDGGELLTINLSRGDNSFDIEFDVMMNSFYKLDGEYIDPREKTVEFFECFRRISKKLRRKKWWAS